MDVTRRHSWHPAGRDRPSRSADALRFHDLDARDEALNRR